MKLLSKFRSSFKRVPATMMKYKKFFKEKMTSDAIRAFVKSNKSEDVTRLINSKEILMDVLDLLVAGEAFKKNKKDYNDFRGDIMKFISDLESMIKSKL